MTPAGDASASRRGDRARATLPSAPDLLAAPFAGGVRPGQLDIVPPLLARDDGGRDLVVLVDGMGSELLEEHLALTPTLRRLRDEVRTVRSVAPSTTATAMTSLITGLAPLEHGVLGYLTRDPRSGRAVNQLTGAAGIDPAQWMPCPVPAERTRRRALQVAPAKHAGSLLTGSAFRGWEFFAQAERGDRTGAALAALRAGGDDALVHLHVDDVDHAGHRHGVDSDAWRDALVGADSLIGTLLRRAPTGTRVHVTADHGMVDTAPERTIDLARVPQVRRGLAMVAGEPRALVLFARRPEDAPALVEATREAVGEHAVVLSREEMLGAGLLGPETSPSIPPHLLGRVGDAIVLARGRWVVDDSRRHASSRRPETGVHGSLTSAESLVPLLTVEV
ncbi:alkaline phosphatase family protein [Brachybacterium subflavum]|uniref:alkaline phosphatase family protein n=1 Tax=Brachybacterium subflavum TaxID=2585206 RepID=UPI0012661940|nr:nucleotide pyrophosphatase/phosphodiesterase family protein [Brachybacterium subflavum]